MYRVAAILLMLQLATLFSAIAQQPLYRNTELSFEKRIEDLLHTLTLEEKISLLGYNSPAIDRLGIPAYIWWNEALHGVARAGEATVFPQAIGLAATFNPELIRQVADAISTEARAKYNLATTANKRLQYMGLTFWSPNINIFRDPRWGRGQETYGEDPFLIATIGSSFVQGLQGNDRRYLKASAGAKHFAVHSGPEISRHEFNAVVDEKDLRETYLYAFKRLVDNGVESIMCAYNRVNDEPCCTGNTLLGDILRKEWHFKGHVVTDCWALDDIWLRHKFIPTRVEVAAAAIQAGVNLDCANILQDDVMSAIGKKMITPVSVDEALKPQLMTRMKLGFFDKEKQIPFSTYGADSINNAAHIALARKAAQQSMVLLKNNGALPIDKNKLTSILVTGSNAVSLDALMGNYHGVSGNMVTYVEGITAAAGPSIVVQYDQGCDFTDTTHFGGIWVSENSDVTIAVIGLTPLLEGEDGDAFLSPSHGDKTSLSLPASQISFLKKLRASHKKPIIAVVTGGSAVDIDAVSPHADAIIFSWYSGEQGGNALADILFGDVSPSGRLPVTFYNSLDDLPSYADYSMKQRTYRYFTGKVQHPFGFGLSYTSFDYQWKTTPKAYYSGHDTIICSVTIQNIGKYDGDEVLQVYIQYPDMERMPRMELKAFSRANIKKGASTEVSVAIPMNELRKWDLRRNAWKLYSGDYTISVGKNSDEIVLQRKFSVK